MRPVRPENIGGQSVNTDDVFVGRTWDEPVDLRDPFRRIAPNKGQNCPFSFTMNTLHIVVDNDCGTLTCRAGHRGY
jgi:hypothetical protein